MYRRMLLIRTATFIATIVLILGLGLGSSGAGVALSQGKLTPTPTAPLLTPTPTAQIVPVGPDDDSGTLERLRVAIVPSRDRVDLARRLLGVTDIPTPPAVPRTYNLGDREFFNASGGNNGGTRQVEAELVYVTPSVYVWFEVGTNPDMEAVRRSVDNFERAIPIMREYFGQEESPGIDGDPRLHILHAHDLGDDIAAYYAADSELPRIIAPESNERQMFFVNLDNMADDIGTSEYEATLIHEYQHMIHNNMDLNENIWLDEGMAELAALVTGFQEQSGFSAAFTGAPETQLNTWTASGSASRNYGAAFLFMAYYLNRFGPEAVRALIANPMDDLESVTDTLLQLGITDPVTGAPVTADDVFQDWIIANLVDDPAVGDGRFTYSPTLGWTTPLYIADTLAPDEPAGISITQWGTIYLALTEPGRYNFSFSGNPTARIVPVEAHSGNLFWWSNRGDQIESRMTRAFDLRNVTSATLNFWLWFATEDDYDFGYVMVSTDGGATWTTLSSGASRTDTQSLYGPTYTGTIGGEKNPGWQQQSIDLSAYTGREILVRFAYITDLSINEPGIAIDDISIPEIGYSTDAETDDGGWTAEGWVRIQNTLPQRFSVQMVRFGEGVPELTRLLGPGDGYEGEWSITLEGEKHEVIIAIAGMTEFTNEPALARYTLTRIR